MANVVGSGTDKKKIRKLITQPVNENAGTRDPTTHVDDTTSFGIPGSGLPRRHCNTAFSVTVAVASDLSVYMAMHDGKIYQNVFGQVYKCRMYTCPHYFEIYIPRGATGWDGAQFLDSSGNDCSADVAMLCDGDVKKAYDKSNPFEWVFGPCFQMSEGDEYYENDITKQMPYRVDQYGGFSQSDSRFVSMGNLTDYSWKQEMGSSADGKIYLCGGILYGNATITSEITAKAVEIIIPGLNLANYYYPGDIQKGNRRMSLNRPEGYIRIYSPSRTAEYLDSEDGWRDIKNTENDRAVEEGAFENWGFRLEGGEWIRLIITGEGGQAGEGDLNGIGADGDDSGSCPCCCRGGNSD